MCVFFALLWPSSKWFDQYPTAFDSAQVVPPDAGRLAAPGSWLLSSAASPKRDRHGLDSGKMALPDFLGPMLPVTPWVSSSGGLRTGH